MFCDELKIKIIAGSGGNGSVSFRREKFVPKGGPDGGDGGRGGSIIFKVNQNLSNLSHLANLKTYKAEPGGNGKGRNMTGKNSMDLILEVPQGTMIFTANKSSMIADLSKTNDQTVAARGGKGGLGNARFVSSTNQVPRFAENGEPGEEKEILLELKLMADVGLIGLPSVGKSTLISVISNARPKIAAYPFTTLIPNLGVVNISQFGGSKEQSFVVADIPGLIEGASLGKGLGHKFLRHVTRTKLLVHIIDATLENADKNYKILNSELETFDPKLAKVKQIIAINKIDMLDQSALDQKIQEIKKTVKRAKIFTFSCITKKGLKELVFEIIKQLAVLKKEKNKLRMEEKDETTNIPVLRPHLEKVKYIIQEIVNKEDHKIFNIAGKRIEQLISMTNTNNPEGLERIYHYLDRMGIQKAVERHGATYGDIIRIKEKDIPYRK